MTWMTLEQFKEFALKCKCNVCGKYATWTPARDGEKTLSYCDDHYSFPYAQKNEKNEHDDDNVHKN